MYAMLLLNSIDLMLPSKYYENTFAAHYNGFVKTLAVV
jgi:hypothetical protein